MPCKHLWKTSNVNKEVEVCLYCRERKLRDTKTTEFTGKDYARGILNVLLMAIFVVLALLFVMPYDSAPRFIAPLMNISCERPLAAVALIGC